MICKYFLPFSRLPFLCWWFPLLRTSFSLWYNPTYFLPVVAFAFGVRSKTSLPRLMSRSLLDFPGGAVVKNRLPMQETRVWALVQEDPTCRRATKPLRHNYWACTLEPVSHNYWTHVPRACAPQQEKPPRWEARAPQRRVAPAHRN